MGGKLARRQRLYWLGDRIRWGIPWRGIAIYFSGSGGASFTKITDPLGRIYRTDVSSDGLTHTSRVWATEAAYDSDTTLENALKKTTTIYGSNSEGLRVTDVTTTDGSSTKKTAVTYATVAGVSVPYDVAEYEGANIYRHTVTNYVTDTAYSNLHIFGLPRETLVYSGPGTTNLIARTEYFYDESAYFDTNNFTVIQHDGSSHGTGFVTGRANLTTVKQYQVPGSGSRNVTQTKYDKTGMVVSVTDAANNTGWFYYDDNLQRQRQPQHARAGDEDQRPGRLLERDEIQIGTTGSPTQELSHRRNQRDRRGAKHTPPYGYDTFDRRKCGHAPGRPETPFGPNGTTGWRWAVYTEIDTGLTQYSFTAYNGAGNQCAGQGADNLNGVSGKYRRENLRIRCGRAGAAEIRWKRRWTAGRRLLTMMRWPTTEPAFCTAKLLTTRSTGRRKSNTLTTNTVKFDYVGCGCAGTRTVTVEDERNKKRRQIYDTFGRLAEAQELDVTNPGSPTVYSRAKYVYDERDLLQRIEHSATNSSHYQQRTFSYDGYGRLTGQTTPEAGTISYTYKPHDLGGHRDRRAQPRRHVQLQRARSGQRRAVQRRHARRVLRLRRIRRAAVDAGKGTAAARRSHAPITAMTATSG